jgi:hypothetical protein
MMAKVDAHEVAHAYDRLAAAKAEHFRAHATLEATPEFAAARKADHELEWAEDCLAGIQMLLSPKVV